MVAPQPVGRPELVAMSGSAGRQSQEVRSAAEDRSRPAKASKRSRSGWWTVLQFVVGLLVIIGVAAAVVALYIRYYQ